MNQIVVNISDMKCAHHLGDVLVTFSLGSCLGVTAYDPVLKIGAMVHSLLPNASVSPSKAAENPFMFVNSGVAAMVKAVIRLGAKRRNLVFKAAGGADMRGDVVFRTGMRNYETLLSLFEKNRITLAAANVGGVLPRTMYLHLDTGRVVVRTFGKDTEV